MNDLGKCFARGGRAPAAPIARGGARPTYAQKICAKKNFDRSKLFPPPGRIPPMDRNEEGRRIGWGHPRARHPEENIEFMIRALEAGVPSRAVGLLAGVPAATARAVGSGRSRRQTPRVEAECGGARKFRAR